MQDKGQDTMRSSNLPWTAYLSYFEKPMQLLCLLRPSYVGPLLQPPNLGHNLQIPSKQVRWGQGGRTDSQERGPIIGPMSRGHHEVIGPPIPNLPGPAV